MSEDVPVTLKAIAAADGVNASITVGAPINKTYSGVIAGSQVVIVIPAVDVVLATVMPYTSTAEGSTKTKSGNFIIDSALPVQIQSATIVGSSVSVVLLNDQGAQIDAHLSTTAHPATDADPVSNDLGDTSGLGVTSEFTFGTLPAGQYDAYLRIYYSLNDWNDSGTTIADGRFIDMTIAVDIDGSAATAGMQHIDLGTSDIALGSVDANDFDTFMSPLARDYALNGGADVGVGIIAGKRALRCLLSIAGATNSRPTNRVSTGYDLTPSHTYKMATAIYLPANFDGGGTKNSKPFGTGKIGPGLYSNVDVSGGTIDPSGFSMRWVYNVDPDTDDIIPGVYDYSTDRSSVWGDVHAMPNRLERGQWNYLWMEVTSNSSASLSDGRIRAWQGASPSSTPQLDITGKQMISSGSDTRISRCKIEVFMGGSGTDAVTFYTPASDQEISFADMYIGPGTFSF